MKGTRCYKKMGKDKCLIRPFKPNSWLLWDRGAGSSGLRVPQQPRTGGAGAAGRAPRGVGAAASPEAAPAARVHAARALEQVPAVGPQPWKLRTQLRFILYSNNPQETIILCSVETSSTGLEATAINYQTIDHRFFRKRDNKTTDN